MERVLRLSTGANAGSGVAVIFTPQGPKQVSGSGSTEVVITGQVVNAEGVVIGDLCSLELEALKALEQELEDIWILA